MDSAGVIVQNADLTVCYDERGSYFLSGTVLYCEETPVMFRHKLLWLRRC